MRAARRYTWLWLVLAGIVIIMVGACFNDGSTNTDQQPKNGVVTLKVCANGSERSDCLKK